MDFNLGEDADMVRQTVHEFVRRDLLPNEPAFLNARDEQARAAIVASAVAALKEMGMYSAGVPEQFGGGGLGPLETCLVAEELAQTIIPVEWGEPTPLLYECNDDQRPDYLLPVVEGSRRYAVGFAEPVSFSDPAGMTTAVVSDSEGYVLSGTKTPSRADFDFCLIFARATEGVTCFILHRSEPNAEVRVTDTGTWFVLKDCRVGSDRVLGKPGKALMLGRKWFPLTRIVRAAAVLGSCNRLLQVTARYAHDWTQMGRHISERGSIQQALGDMVGDIEALRWLGYRTAWLAAEGKAVEEDSLLLKLQAHKVLKDTVNRSVRIHGGTIPPIAGWLARRGEADAASDGLKLAVARQTMSRLQP